MFINTKVEGGKDFRYTILPLAKCTLQDARAIAQKDSKVVGVVKLKYGFAIRCRWEHFRRVQRQINPNSVNSDSDSEEIQVGKFSKPFRLENVQTKTTRSQLTQALLQVGWKAHVIRALGPSSWAVVADQDPPVNHLTLNGYLAVIRADFKGPKIAKPVITSPMVLSAPAPATAGPVQSKLEQFESQIEQRISRIVAEKLDELQTQLQDKVGTIESNVAALQKDANLNEQRYNALHQQVSSVERTQQTSFNGLMSAIQALTEKVDDMNDTK
ncbi:unnamed protein product, partial [Durusdinium trenchii]